MNEMRRLDTVWGKKLIELTVPALLAWQFINAEENTSWTMEYDGVTYVGCRVRSHRPIDANNVRITFTFKSDGTLPFATPGP